MKEKRKPLLSTNNYKTVKGEKLGYTTLILYMSPHKQNNLGKNVCSHASVGCAASCLVGSGFGGMFPTVQEGRRARTEYFLTDRVAFLNQIKDEITAGLKKHKHNEKSIVVVRLNGTSDLPYENFRIFDGKNIFEVFPDIQFYDYTKVWTRFDKALPLNYHLTFSKSETNTDKCFELLAKGVNVAMVFDKTPTEYKGYKVVDADENDLRFLDPKGVICGLRYKKMTGKGADNSLAFTSGFAIRTLTVQDSINKIGKAVKKGAKKKAKVEIV